MGKKKGLFKTKQTGIQHGYGIFDCDGGIAEGQFLNGKFVQGTMKTPSGDMFEGSFDTNLKLNGEGAAYYKNGQTLVFHVLLDSFHIEDIQLLIHFPFLK